jgi:hypothetical protein
MDQQAILRRSRALTAFFMAGLVSSGATALPILPELDWLVSRFPAEHGEGILGWLEQVREVVAATDAAYPFLAYGTDWLAFGHFVIALAFVGAWRDPVRNVWLYEFGMLACLLVLPYAALFGAVRGIPPVWRLIDCSFGILGFLPLWYSRRLVLLLQPSSQPA